MTASFEESKRWAGARAGYVFTTRKGLTGYFKEAEVVEKKPKKRKTPEAFGDDNTTSVEAILTRADEIDVSELTASSLKHLLLAFEKKITRNQQLRAKFADEPAKFVESEVDLDEAIKELGVVAAAPELYPVLVETGGARSIVGLLSHDNADIAASAIGLLYDLTDAEALAAVNDEEVEECAEKLVEAISQESDGFELLAQNLERFDETKGEDSTAVHNTLGVFENVSEICRGRSSQIFELACGSEEKKQGKTATLIKWLLDRCRSKKFDPNKLYASEILAIIGSYSEKCALALGRATTADGANGVDALLQAAAHYRRRSPQGEEEEECLENLFDAIAASVTSAPKPNVELFLQAEGVELMLRCAREGRLAAACALKVLDAALTSSSAVPELFLAVSKKLVEKGGLKVAFPAVMGRGAARPPKGEERSSKTRKLKRKRRSADEQRLCDEHVLSIVAQLCVYADDPKRPEEATKRVIAKFMENDMEKLNRVIELYALYAERTSHAASEGLELNEELDDEQREAVEHSTLLQAGLHALRLAAQPLAFAAVHSPKCRAVVVEAFKKRGADPEHLATTLSQEANDLRTSQEASFKAAVLSDWAAALLAIPTSSPDPPAIEAPP